MDFEQLKCDNCYLKTEPWSEERLGLTVYGCPRCGEDLVVGGKDLRDHSEFRSSEQEEDTSEQEEPSLDEKMRQAGL